MSPRDLELRQALIAADASGSAAAILAAYRVYLGEFPGEGWAWNNAGVAARQLGERVEAEFCYRRAIDAGWVERFRAFANLCQLYLEDGRVDAVDYGREAVRLAPEFAVGWWFLGNALVGRGAAAEALAAFRRAEVLGADLPPSHLYVAMRQACDWEGLAGVEARLLAAAANSVGEIPAFVMFAYAPTTGAVQLDFARRMAAERFPQVAPPVPAPTRGGARIRLGYVSADFRHHATTHLLVNTIENHDRGAFEVIGFDIGPPEEGLVRRRILQAFDESHDLFRASDDLAAKVIREQKIDILLDLNGFATGGRPGIFARRPAPVQVNYLGWPGTSGAPFMDWIIADRTVAPDAAEFSEDVAWLEGAYQPTDSRRVAAPAPSRASLGLPDEAIVIASMNSPWKLTPTVLDVWADILTRAPRTVLWQLADSGSEVGLRAEAARRGIGERLILAPHVDQPAHLGRLAVADLALDAFPCGGHTTTSDLLWAGVPVLTLMGESFSGRVGASLARVADLGDLVCASADAYRARAIDLLNDPEALAALKARAQAARSHSALFQNEAYTRGLEAAFKRMLAQ
jgi:predicted O-linked N-acetylglucosamine transferase (SPINDLY family)